MTDQNKEPNPDAKRPNEPVVMLDDLIDKVIKEMPNICKAAIQAGVSPFNITTDMGRVAGFEIDDIQKVNNEAHKWLWEHKSEYPWNINQPSEA